MGFFSSAPKRVNKNEMKDIMSKLYGKLDEEERVEVEKLFRADLNEAGLEVGVSQAEFDAAMVWLRDNMQKHELEPDDIALIEKYFAEHLKD